MPPLTASLWLLWTINSEKNELTWTFDLWQCKDGNKKKQSKVKIGMTHAHDEMNHKLEECFSPFICRAAIKKYLLYAVSFLNHPVQFMLGSYQPTPIRAK